MTAIPLVSVVTATYNMAHYLGQAIQSVLAQTYANVELLIVDDGSTDNTREVVDAFLADSRVKYLTQENKGQAAAKNRGILESSGEYVAFLDADDMWAPEKLELQIPLFAGIENLGVVYSRVACIDKNGSDLGVSNGELFRGCISSRLLIYNFVGFGTAVVKRECFDRLGGFDENYRMAIDYDLWLRFSTEYEFDFVDRPLLYYRWWPGQLSNNYTKERYFCAVTIMKNFLNEFPDVVPKNIENEAWAHTYVGFGQCLKRVDQRLGPALRLYARALRYRPSYLPAWKAIVRTILDV
jgi:glycosyltransferase involved in cell wall biosynthesis